MAPRERIGIWLTLDVLLCIVGCECVVACFTDVCATNSSVGLKRCGVGH